LYKIKKLENEPKPNKRAVKPVLLTVLLSVSLGCESGRWNDGTGDVSSGRI
jgi:hypothetical protein